MEKIMNLLIFIYAEVVEKTEVIVTRIVLMNALIFSKND